MLSEAYLSSRNTRCGLALFALSGTLVTGIAGLAATMSSCWTTLATISFITALTLSLTFLPWMQFEEWEVMTNVDPSGCRSQTERFRSDK